MDQLAKDPETIVEATAVDVDPEAGSPQAIVAEDAFGPQEQAFTIPDSSDDFEMPEPVVGEPQTFDLPEPIDRLRGRVRYPGRAGVETEVAQSWSSWTSSVGQVRGGPRAARPSGRGRWAVRETAEPEAIEPGYPALRQFEPDAPEVPAVAETPEDHPGDNGSASELNQLAVELGQAREENDQLSTRSRTRSAASPSSRVRMSVFSSPSSRSSSSNASVRTPPPRRRGARGRASARARACRGSRGAPYKRLAKAKARNEELERLVDEMVSGR